MIRIAVTVQSSLSQIWVILLSDSDKFQNIATTASAPFLQNCQTS